MEFTKIEETCIEKIEYLILESLSSKKEQVFLDARKATEGILVFILYRHEILPSLEFNRENEFFKLKEKLEKKLPDLSNKIGKYIDSLQVYGNYGAHFSTEEISEVDTASCKRSIYELSKIFYKDVLQKDIPDGIMDSMPEDDSKMTVYSKDLIGIFHASNKMMVDLVNYAHEKPRSVGFSILNLIVKIMEYCLTSEGRRIPVELYKEGTSKINIRLAREYLVDKGIFNKMIEIHFKNLHGIQHRLYKTPPAVKSIEIGEKKSIQATVTRVLEWFYLEFLEYDIPDEIASKFKKQQIDSVRDEQITSFTHENIKAWLVRDDEVQTMYYPLFEGENIIGRYDRLEKGKYIPDVRSSV